MRYSKELIDEVKEVYPNAAEMIQAAETGNKWLGRYLCDNVPNYIPFETVLRSESLEELKAIAAIGKRKQDLYRKCCLEYDNVYLKS